MVGHSNILRHATLCINCVSLISTRSFYVSASRLLPEKVASSGPVVAEKIKIKTKFSELPSAFVLPDGTFAAPLGEWNGGNIDESRFSDNFDFKKLLRGRTRKIKNILNGSEVQPQDILAEQTIEVKPIPSEKTAFTLDEFHGISVPKKRTRKKLVVESEETDEPTLKTPRKRAVKVKELDNEEAVSSKIRRKRVVKEDINSDTDDVPAVQTKTRRTRVPKAKEIENDTVETPATQTKTRRKRVSKVKVTDIDIEDVPAIQTPTKLAKLIQDNLLKFPHCILLTRVGGFYESYFDQAIEVAQTLNIKLTSRQFDGRRVPMCGFPLLHLAKHLKVLVQEHKRFVAMCEEFPRYSFGGIKEFDRRVARVITPGTLIDEPFLNQYENNYLLAISSRHTHTPHEDVSHVSSVGLAWIDVSTGEFFSKPSTYESLQDELARINPREVVLDQALGSNVLHPIRLALAEEGSFVAYTTPSETLNYAYSTQETPADILVPPKSSLDAEPFIARNSTENSAPIADISIPVDDPDLEDCTDDVTDLSGRQSSTSSSFTPDETSAINLLTTYLHANLLEHMPALSWPHREATGGRMQIDSHTIKALEIREGIREGGVKGSLTSVIKRTTTSSGTRLLSRWLCSPSTSIPEINARQSLVAFFHKRDHFRADLLALLRDAEDAGRIVQKFVLGRGDTTDLLALQATISAWSSIKKYTQDEKRFDAERDDHRVDEWTSLDALMSRMVDLSDLSDKIDKALYKTRSANSNVGATSDLTYAPVTWKYGHTGWTIKPEFSEKLTTLHSTLEDLLKRRETLQGELQLAFDAPSLTLRSSPAQGMHVHLARGKRDQAKLNQSFRFISLSESSSTKSYFNLEWSQLGNSIVETTTSLFEAEREAFDTLRNEVNGHTVHLRRNARIVDELDVTLALATLAQEMNFVQPLMRDDTSYEVINGRHPTVELGLLTSGRVFTPNSIHLDTSRLQIITGPNMAGKSTFLRQTALIAILAQTGSFVPADSAVIGIVDRVFSRVGAKDDLFHDRSTFMVEMLETAEILRRATPRSLVIMDEVGRGTTVKDGLAIAFATVHHLVSVNQCRALFATHFHELADMLGYASEKNTPGAFENVAFFCTDVDEADDEHFAYSYRMRPGVNRDSHGLKVAQLAGMPTPAMAVAKDALSWLKSQKEDVALNAKELNAIGWSLSQPKTPEPIL